MPEGWACRSIRVLPGPATSAMSRDAEPDTAQELVAALVDPLRWPNWRPDDRLADQPSDSRGPRRPRSGGPGPHAVGQPCRLEAGRGPSRPDRTARGAEPNPGAGPCAGPAWPDDGVTVHLLPWRRPDHGRRPQRYADSRPGCAAVR